MVKDSVKFLVDTMLKQEREEEERLDKVEVEQESAIIDKEGTEETIKIHANDNLKNQQSSSICWYC